MKPTGARLTVPTPASAPPTKAPWNATRRTSGSVVPFVLRPSKNKRANHAVRIVDVASGEVSTLALTNLGVAVNSAQGRTIKVSLPAQEVSPDADTVELRLSAPEGYKLNDLIESHLTLATSNADAFDPSETALTFQVSDTAVEFQAPVSAASGQAILSATGEVYYCREGEEAVCLIDKVDLALPITVVAGGAAVAVIDYELPQ